MVPSQLVGVNVTRTICNLLVVLVHATIVSAYATPLPGERTFWHMITSIVAYVALPTLFYTSGFLAAYSLSSGSFAVKFTRRVGRLLVPYVCWNIIFVCAYLCTMKIIPSSEIHVNQWNLTTLTGIYTKVLHPFAGPCDAPFWYIRSIFYLFLLTPFILKCIRRAPIFVSLCIFAWFCITCIDSVYERIVLTFPWYGVAAYCLGVCQFSRSKSFLALAEHRFVVFGILALISECMTFAIFGKEPLPLRSLCQFLEIPLALALAKRVETWLNSFNAWKVITEASFYIYATHFLLSSLVYHLFRVAFKDRICLSVTIGVLVYFAGGLVLMVLSRFMLKKLAPGLLNVLEGKILQNR